MTQPAPHLRVVDAETGEIHEGGCPNCAELEDKIAGYQRTVDKQARDIGGLERRLTAQEDGDTRPASNEIRDLIEKAHRGTGHPNRKVSADRVKLVRARLKDTFTFDDLNAAVDGLIANPYRSYGKPSPTGTPAQRDDDLSTALGSAKAVETYANLGVQAGYNGDPHKGEETPRQRANAPGPDTRNGA